MEEEKIELENDDLQQPAGFGFDMLDNQEFDEQKTEDSPNSEISDLSKKGYQKLKENKNEEAISIFNKILEIEENNNYALVGLGDSERKRHNYKEAIKYYSTCLEYYPGNNYALFGLADCYKATNHYKQAISIWEEYLIHDDRNITVLTRVADAYRKIHDFKKSKQVYLNVLDMEEDNAYALIGLGHLHYDFREYKDALFYWTRMFEINETNCDIRVLTSIGNCYRKLKIFDKGLVYFDKALALEPKNFYALFGIADCYRGLNQQFRSIEYWNKILEFDPNNKVILTRAGDAYRNTGDYEKATSYYNRAMDIDFDIYAALGLALICKCEGKYKEAMDRLENLIKNDEKNFRLYIDLADCHMKLNQRQEAVQVLQRFQKLGLRSQPVSDYLNRILNNR